MIDNKDSQNKMNEEKRARGQRGEYINGELVAREMTDEEEEQSKMNTELMDYRYGKPKKVVEEFRRLGWIKDPSLTSPHS